MMFASKMPSLRLEQGDLKCKNGCDYYGNPQWQGYCSKCHREQMQRQRRAEKATSSTLPKPEQKKQERGLKLTSRSSFSKFEEKRLRQSETLKKANLLKLTTVFKKSSNDEHDHSSEKRAAEFKIPSSVNEGMKRDFSIRFPSLPQQIDKDARVFVYSFIMDVIKHANTLTVDELSERVQRQYQRFLKHMDTSSQFANIDADTKELLIDFVEKHAMTYLHELPSVVFSPSGTEDERADRAMCERVQQLAWLGERHLECDLDRNDAHCRQLLYKAISELLGMDSAPSPGGKLARVRRACLHVLALCHAAAPAAAPASADDLLPALIFTVLKANPPRLVSNINFVTRFCNAQRLMTGEGGYYFTNLCCAVSFIENLTAESLNMDKKEFDCYMAMPASIGGSSWAAALSLCAELRECEAQRALAQGLLQRARHVAAAAGDLHDNALTFQTEIEKKVKDVLAKTPLEIKPRREMIRPGKLRTDKVARLIDIDSPAALEDKPTAETEATKLLQIGEPTANPEAAKKTDQNPNGIEQSIESKTESASAIGFTESKPEKVEIETDDPNQKLTILGFEVIEHPSPSRSPQNLDHTWDVKQTNSMELLTPSPLGYTPFDSRSIDELLTPEEFVSDHLAPGLSNINYDLDLSDLSGDNSVAEDAPKPKDPFSPEGIKVESFDPFAPKPRDPFSPILDKFDQFSLTDGKSSDYDPFEVLNRDPFTPVASSAKPEGTNISIIDDNDSPTTGCLLPSPLVPQTDK